MKIVALLLSFFVALLLYFFVPLFFCVSNPSRASTGEQAKPKIVLDNTPERGMPPEAEAQARENRGKAESLKDKGSLAKLLGDSVDTVRIRYFSKLWENDEQVRLFLAGLLAADSTRVFSVPLFAQPLFVPDIECHITYGVRRTVGDGRLLIWKSVACVRDRDGKWWFVNLTDYWLSKFPPAPDPSAIEK